MTLGQQRLKYLAGTRRGKAQTFPCPCLHACMFHNVSLLCQGVSRGEAVRRVAAACVTGSAAWSSAVNVASAKAPAPVMKLPDGELRRRHAASSGARPTHWCQNMYQYQVPHKRRTYESVLLPSDRAWLLPLDWQRGCPRGMFTREAAALLQFSCTGVFYLRLLSSVPVMLMGWFRRVHLSVLRDVYLCIALTCGRRPCQAGSAERR